MIWAVGSLVKTGSDLCEVLRGCGIEATLVNARFVKPLDTALLAELAKDHKAVLTLEENVKNGGFGSMLLSCIQDLGVPVRVGICAVEDHFIDHAEIKDQRVREGLDAKSLKHRALELLKQTFPERNYAEN